MKHIGAMKLGSLARCAALLAALSAPVAASAGEKVCAEKGAAEKRALLERKDLPYTPMVLNQDGTADAAELDALAGSLHRRIRDERTQVVVLVHGFAVDAEHATHDYRDIAQRLRAEATAAGLREEVVGLYWPSASGDAASWMLKATGNRITSLLGFRHAVANPYLEKCKLAGQTGRTGLRALLFRIQSEFPRNPVNLFSHSLGAQVVVSALAPETSKARDAVEQPGRALRVGVVTLAGADLDCDAFNKKNDIATRLALKRAAVWWVTLPKTGEADAVLELRRGAGKCDAVGNRGLELSRDDLNRLIGRRALVLDQGNVPSGHGLTDYYNNPRLDDLVASMLYLQDPATQNTAARGSVLAQLDRVLKAEPGEVACDEATCASVKLYAAWKQDPSTDRFGTTVWVSDRDSSARMRARRRGNSSGSMASGAGE